MPLIKSGSKAAMSHNIKAEMRSGKPQKQALAIAYSVKRKAQHKAHGGQVMPSKHDMVENVQDPKKIVASIMGRKSAPKPKHMEEHDADMARMAETHVEPMEHVMADDEDMPEHMLAHGGMLGEAEPSEEGMDELHAERMEGDQSNFLSDEEDMETPFHSTKSDEMELDEHDMGAHPKMDNEEGNEDQDEARKSVLSRIVNRLRMQHMGRK